MSDSASNSKYRYAVVWFRSEKKTELVPLSWVYNEGGQDFCYYPPKKEYKHMDAWLDSCADPGTHWKSFLTEILSRTKTLEKGKRRLERSYDTRNIESTDSENSNPPKTPVILPEKTIKKSLQNVPTVSSSVQKENNNDDTLAANKITTESLNALKEYLNSKLHELELSVGSCLENMTRSILHEVESQLTEVKNMIIAKATGDVEATVGATLPIKNLNDFLEFDAALRNNEDKRKALMTLYRVLVCGECQSKGCVSKIMVATITKSVELHYSGTGHVGKKNFSATTTYSCLKDTLLEKFGCGSHEMENLEERVGIWLSGDADQNGGRAARKK